MERMRMMLERGEQRMFAGGRGGLGRRGGRGGGRGPGGGDGLGGRGRDWHDALGDRPQRAERGAVKYLVMDAIKATARHGYEIIQVIAEKSHDAYKPSPGVIYPTLQMLEDIGHVKTSTRDDKKVYALNAAGLRELDDNRDMVERFYEEADDAVDDPGEELRDLMHRSRRLLRAFRRAARRGLLTTEVRTKLRTTLEGLIEQLESLAG